VVVFRSVVLRVVFAVSLLVLKRLICELRRCVADGAFNVACYHPLVAYRGSDGAITFADRGRGDQLLLPCGQCVGCRLERSRQWAVRCLHESKSHARNCFITLTYDDDHVPYDGSLDYTHYQLFMKRLRKALGPARFYMCGEYGDDYGRPHYHACLFGVDFPDRVVQSRSGSGFFVYRSDLLSSLWPHGFSSVADFSFETAAYVARYVMKKITGQAGETHYDVVNTETGEIFSRTPEFCRMSLKPGIGALWFDRYGMSDVVVRDSVIVNGVEATVPRYYDKLLKRRDPMRYDDVKVKRALDNYARVSDNTDARLADKEEVVTARIRSLKRKL
jgi:hypothetical protein